MNESASTLTGDLQAIAADLQAMKCWGDLPLEILLTQMRDGGAPATEAWITVLKQCVRLPMPSRQKAETMVARYQQAAGRWVIAETKERLSRHPYPAVR